MLFVWKCKNDTWEWRQFIPTNVRDIWGRIFRIFILQTNDCIFSHLTTSQLPDPPEEMLIDQEVIYFHNTWNVTCCAAILPQQPFFSPIHCSCQNNNANNIWWWSFSFSAHEYKRYPWELELIWFSAFESHWVQVTVFYPIRYFGNLQSYIWG